MTNQKANQQQLPPAIFLMGPTACGKTGLAVELVRRLPLEIVSVDSAMVYRGMDIGTAKPEEDVLRVAPHALIDILDPPEPYSAGRFREDALREMRRITGAGRVPLLTGGTFLYFRALEQGFSELPSADPAVRTALDLELEQSGLAVMHRRLAAVDPESAARIHANDSQRILRALEVYEISGQTLTELRNSGTCGSVRYRFVKLALVPTDRVALHDRIERRFRQMLERGFLDEVRALYRCQDLGPDLPSMRAVGYRQAWQHLAGELDERQWITAAITATRQYAKRQMTWLRGETGVAELPVEEHGTTDKALKFIGL